jgi:hypothetical protein
MFYCHVCKEKMEWPDSILVSYGPCEICGAIGECNDIPSKYLPIPRSSTDEQLPTKQ